MGKTIKIFTYCHKPCRIVETEFIKPLQVGAALSKEKLPMLHDDEGENISRENGRLCELTGQYWVWKNVNADYYGFMHYRRHFVFSEISEQPRTDGTVSFPSFSDEYLRHIGLDDESIRSCIADYDLILPLRVDVRNWGAVNNEVQFSSLMNMHAREFSMVCDTIRELYPEYEETVEKFKNGHYAYWFNMFIMRKELFFDYCKWLFSILEVAGHRVEYENMNPAEQRTLAFMAERLFSIYVDKLIKESPDLKIKHLKMTFLDNTELDNAAYKLPAAPPQDFSIIKSYKELEEIGKVMVDTLVSVIIPVYNEEKYLGQCLDSVLEQSLHRIEVICVDDGSTDNSLKILDTYQKKDQRIKIVQQENQYAGAARNNGMKLAKGKYLYFLDADDYLSNEDVLLNLVDAAEKNRAEIITFLAQDAEGNAERGETLAPNMNSALLPEGLEVFSAKEVAGYLYQIYAGWAWDKLFKRDFIEKTRLRFQGLRSSNDGLFVLVALAMAERIIYVPEACISHRTAVKTSIVQNRDMSPACCVEMIAGIYEELEKRHLLKNFRQSLDNYTLFFLMWHISSLTSEKGYLELYPLVVNKLESLMGECEDNHFYNKELLVLWQFIRHASPWSFMLYRNRLEMLKTNNQGNVIRNQSSIIEDLNNYVMQLKNKIEEMKVRRHWRCQTAQLHGKRVAIYGAGAVGRDIFKQLSESQYITVVNWVDKKWEKYRETELQISPVTSLSDRRDFDVILIALSNPAVCLDVRKDLLAMGIDEECVYMFPDYIDKKEDKHYGN